MATLNSYIYFCNGNTIGILTDNWLVATYALFCLCIPVSNAAVEWVFSHVTSVFKIWKLCDFKCVKDRYQRCVIFACFKVCSWYFQQSSGISGTRAWPESSITTYIGEREFALYIYANTHCPTLLSF